VLLVQIAAEAAEIRVEIKAGKGFASLEAKTLRITTRPGKVLEMVAVISVLPARRQSFDGGPPDLICRVAATDY